MTAVWTAVGAMLVVGLGLIVWGSLPEPPDADPRLSRRRSRQAQVGAVLAGAAVLVLVVAYLTADWP